MASVREVYGDCAGEYLGIGWTEPDALIEALEAAQ